MMREGAWWRRKERWWWWEREHDGEERKDGDDERGSMIVKKGVDRYPGWYLTPNVGKCKIFKPITAFLAFSFEPKKYPPCNIDPSKYTVHKCNMYKIKKLFIVLYFMYTL